MQSVAEQLVERLVKAAHTRRESIETQLDPKDFEKFVGAVQMLGNLSVQLDSQGTNLSVFGMAADYYSRAIAFMADESAKLADAKPAGSA